MLESIPFNFSEIPPVSLSTALVAVLLVVVLYWMKGRGLPPGPTGLPLIGYYPFLDHRTFYLQLESFARKYGDIFSFRVTGQLYIHLGTLKALREAHVSKADCFADRMTSYSIMKFCFDKGLVYDNGEKWRVLRKFFIQKFKEYGSISSKGNFADPIQDSLTSCIKEIRDSKGEPFDCTTLLTKCCTSSMRQLVFSGVQIPKEEIDGIMAAYVALMTPLEGKPILLCGPISEYLLLPFSPHYREMISAKETMNKYLAKIIKEHESTLNEDDPRDIIDCYIRERNVRTRKNDPTANYFTAEGLVPTLTQFVGDGALGVGFFIGSFFHTLSKYPEVQEKIYSEILEVVGPDRLPTGEDKSRLPYTNAAILEIIRCSDFFPVFPSLKCTKDTTLCGYKIPKGSVTLVNNYAIMRDPKLYEDPNTFTPERYIAKPDKPKAEFPMLFGVGKRACAGESFVMMQCFLFLVTVVKNFKLTHPPEKEDEKFLELRMCAEPRREIEIN